MSKPKGKEFTENSKLSSIIRSLDIDFMAEARIKSKWQVGDEWRYSFERKPEFTKEDVEKFYINLKEDLQREITPIRISPKSIHPDFIQRALFLYTSDKHVGAETRKNTMYGNEYNQQVFQDRMQILLDEIEWQYKKQGYLDKVIVMDLGDPLDGYNGKTTRRSPHNLPQNLTDREQFDVYVRVHKMFFDELVNMDIANEIEFYAVSNDNHSGAFGYCANRALEIYLNVKYPDIKTHIADKFIEHFEYGIHTILYTHGKDEEDMKNGFPIHLNEKTERLINEYLDFHKITGPAHFVKGDLHQSSSELTRRFRYKNVMSLYGSSRWAHTHFGPGVAGVNYDILYANFNKIEESFVQF